MSVVRLSLKPKHDRRVRSGHPWVFSNEIADDLKQIQPGCTVDIHDTKGEFLGRGYANPASLIAVRICTRRRKEDLDHPMFFVERLRAALAWREVLYPGRTALRLIHAAGDGLPGLIIDRFDDHLAVQINTLGMEVRKEALREALHEVVGPKSIVLRNDGRSRELEGLQTGREVWDGDPPETVEIDEFGVKFRVPLLGGQKTGHFFDQAENRRFAGHLCRGRSVLDVYANSGGWALHALHNGATSAITVDKAPENAEVALENAALNGFEDRFEAWTAEGKATLEHLVASGERFGAVILDPPAFAKSRKTAGAALRGYEKINTLGITLVQPDGVFFTSSCSHHVTEDRFLASVVEAARKAGRRLRLVRRGEQAPDHPILPEVPETRYLKTLAFQVLI